MITNEDMFRAFKGMTEAANSLGLTNSSVIRYSDGRYQHRSAVGESSIAWVCQLPTVTVGARSFFGLVVRLKRENVQNWRLDIFDPQFVFKSIQDIHPHVDHSTGRFCFQSHRIISMIENEDYIGAITQIKTVVNTHTPTGAYREVDGTIPCGVCGKYPGQNSGLTKCYSSGCNIRICEDCSIDYSCQATRIVCCSRHLRTITIEGREFRVWSSMDSRDVTTCYNCGSILRINHGYRCVGCRQKYLCQGCQSSSDTELCRDCAAEIEEPEPEEVSSVFPLPRPDEAAAESISSIDATTTEEPSLVGVSLEEIRW